AECGARLVQRALPRARRAALGRLLRAARAARRDRVGARDDRRLLDATLRVPRVPDGAQLPISERRAVPSGFFYEWLRPTGAGVDAGARRWRQSPAVECPRLAGCASVHAAIIVVGA